MKIRRKTGDASGGSAPAQTGGYNYSTDRQQNILFNQGLDPQDPGAGSASYDYSAKSRADRFRRLQDAAPPKIDQSGYGTTFNAAATLRKSNGALNRSHPATGGGQK